MSTETLKSALITDLDNTPPLYYGASAGGPQTLRTTEGFVSPTSGVTLGSLYKLVRLQSCVRLKELKIKLDATVTTLTAAIGFYYSDSTSDYTTLANQGTQVNGNTGGQYFGSAVALAAQTTSLDLMASSLAANFSKELWEICGLTTDPHCPFDIVLDTTTTNSGTAAVYMRATFTNEAS